MLISEDNAMTETGLEADFNEAMIDVYRRAKIECNYNAMYFLRMIGERGGLRAAKDLLDSPAVSSGFTELYLCGRLDLTVEALVLQSRWSSLFTESERTIAAKRLKELGYTPPA